MTWYIFRRRWPRVLGFGVFQSVLSEVFFSTVFCGLNFLNRQLSSDKGHMQISKGVVVCVLGEPTGVQYEGRPGVQDEE